LKTYTSEDFKRWGAQGPKKRKSTRTITPAQQAALQKARKKAKRIARLSNAPLQASGADDALKTK
jgi:hypothetical protein